jgi:hypothetical protein
MTAGPTCSLTDGLPLTTGFVGRFPFAPKSICAANFASFCSAKPLSRADPQVSAPTAALSQRENTPPTPLAAARPIAKSP